MDDLISRQAAVEAIGKTSDELYENIKKGATFPQRQWFDGMAQAQSILENLPSAQPEQYWIDSEGNVSTLPSAQKTGNWTDKSIFYGEEGQIDMWQTCQCSECGRWDTRPYMYYFDEPNYCSYCGAKMQR